MTRSEFKSGDRVRIEIPGISDIGVIISKDTYGYNVKCGENYHYGVCAEYLKPTSLDRKTAFPRELQALLKSHNATIQSYMSGVDTVGLCIYFGDENIEEVDCQHNDTICEIDADNIMDFDKE